MLLRKVFKFLRGRATPVQVLLATVLGTVLGFVSGPGQAAGLVVALVLLLVVLNANLFVATMSGLAARALAVPLAPVSFAAGRLVLDGPAQPLAEAVVNTPVLALLGLEYYATTGGVVVGLVVGLLLGWLIVAGLKRFRRAMVRLEEGSPRYAALSRTWWARTLAFVFIGGRPRKRSWESLLEKKLGLLVRPLGVVIAVLAVGLLVILYQFTSEPIVTALLQRNLERVNGATVDVGSADLDPAAGRLTITGFAMADPNALDRDLLRAERVEADLSGIDLLRKRLALDRLVLVDAATGVTRRVPGRRVGPAPRPAREPRDGWPEGRPLEDYLEQAKTWKTRLAQTRRWLERLAGTGGEPAPDAAGARARQAGYARVRADHLLRGAPAFAVYELVAEKVRCDQLPDETLSIRGRNLSSQPHLLERAPSLLVESSGGTLRAEVGRAEDGTSTIAFARRGLPVDRAAAQLAGVSPISGGTMDVEAAGTWSGAAPVSVDLPLTVTLRDSTISLAGGSPRRIDTLVVPIGVRGPIDDPRIAIDDDALARALAAAGAGELAGRLREKAGRALDEAGGDVPADAIKKGLDGLLGGKKKDP